MSKIKRSLVDINQSEEEEEIDLKCKVSPKAREYILKKGITTLFLLVEFIQEPCTEIYNPIISTDEKIRKNNNVDFLDKEVKIHLSDDKEIILKIEKRFSQRFLKFNKEIEISLGGLLKKKLILENVEPEIINTCKV